jgi:hypothetical protein
MIDKKLDGYIRAGKEGVEGWLARCDGEIFGSLLKYQVDNNIVGAVAEIGVHCGKSFIPMALSNGGRRCYAIDIFGRQELNVDGSGCGNKNRFMQNLTKFGVQASEVFIDERLSSEVLPGDIEERVGRVRFFHIDGGHHFEAIVNDLKLAESVVMDDGILAVDDVFRPEWPEVSMGVFSYLVAKEKDFVPFAIGFNKTYLCQRPFANFYRANLIGNDFLRMYLSKKYKVSNEEILVFQSYQLPEWGVKTRLLNYLKTYHPDLAYSLLKLRQRTGSLKS